MEKRCVLVDFLPLCDSNYFFLNSQSQLFNIPIIKFLLLLCISADYKIILIDGKRNLKYNTCKY